jgi:hypothetical protein
VRALTCGNLVELMGIEPTTPCLQSAQGGRDLTRENGQRSWWWYLWWSRWTSVGARCCPLLRAHGARVAGVDQDSATVEDGGDLDLAAELVDDRTEGFPLVPRRASGIGWALVSPR